MFFFPLENHGTSESLDATSGQVGDSETEKAKIKFVKKFKKATERLDNIISIIDEIVDTIEITDD